MARGLDFSTLTGAERIVLLSGTLTLVNGMIPWWFRVHTPDGSFSHNAGLTGWGVAATVAGAAAALTVLFRASIWPEPAPRRDGIAYAALGLAGVGVLSFQIARTGAEWIGLWVALALALATAFGGLRRRAERRAGWT